jgi:hypothetical protein
VNGSGSQSDDASIHVEWRMAVASRAAQAYGTNPKLAALTVGGSVGAGLADQFSDLELDCYWWTPPDDSDRIGPFRALGGDLVAFWDYDPDDQEWSDDYNVGPLGVTVSNFVTATIERFLDEVVRQADTDPVKHMRMAAVQNCRPLLGAELIASWQGRASGYPDKLAAAMVEQALDPGELAGWAARDALIARGDQLAVADLLARAGNAVFRAVLAVNRVYVPHRQIKWQRHLIAGLALAPQRFAQRLQLLSSQPDSEALAVAETLLADTVRLAEDLTSAELGPFRAHLSDRRRAVVPPPDYR